MKKTTMLLLALAAMISLSACNSAPKAETSSKRETAASAPESTESTETFAESNDTAAESAPASVEAAEPVSSEPEPAADTDTGMQPVVPPIEEFKYWHDKNLGGVVIIKYNGSVPMVIIPDEIDGEPVVTVGESAFDSKTSLKSITIPNSVKSIENYAFSGCKNLTNVELPSSLEKIGMCAFSGCGFSEITLPESLECIEKSAFFKCKNLINVTVPRGVETVNTDLFEGCTTLESVILPEGITTICTGAFEDCNIKSMELPNTLVKMEGGAFGQTGMTQVVLYFKGEEYSVEKGNMKEIWTRIEENAASATDNSAVDGSN